MLGEQQGIQDLFGKLIFSFFFHLFFNKFFFSFFWVGCFFFGFVFFVKRNILIIFFFGRFCLGFLVVFLPCACCWRVSRCFSLCDGFFDFAGFSFGCRLWFLLAFGFFGWIFRSLRRALLSEGDNLGVWTRNKALEMEFSRCKELFSLGCTAKRTCLTFSGMRYFYFFFEHFKTLNTKGLRVHFKAGKLSISNCGVSLPVIGTI